MLPPMAAGTDDSAMNPYPSKEARMSASTTTDARFEIREQARQHVVAALQSDTTTRPLDGKTLDRLAEVIGRDEAMELAEDAYKSVYTLTSTRDELSSKMADATRDFEATETFIRGGTARFNSLGVLQGAGSDIDRLCGLFHAQVDYAVAAQFRLLLAVAKAQA